MRSGRSSSAVRDVRKDDEGGHTRPPFYRPPSVRESLERVVAQLTDEGGETAREGVDEPLHWQAGCLLARARGVATRFRRSDLGGWAKGGNPSETRRENALTS